MIDPRSAPILYPIPDTPEITSLRNQTISGPSSRVLEFDVYLPRTIRPPVVVFNHGDWTPERLKDAKDWAQFTSWSRLMAASGLAAVTFNRSSTENFTRIGDAEAEVKAMLEHVHRHSNDYGVDGERIGVCAFSAGLPTVMPLLLREQPAYVRCIVVYYGLLDLRGPAGDSTWMALPPEVVSAYSARAVLEDLQQLESVPPMLLLRAGRDRPLFNENVDRFYATALARNAAVDLFNHPDGEHAFDVRNDGPRTREAIARTVEFLRWHLGVDPRMSS